MLLLDLRGDLYSGKKESFVCFFIYCPLVETHLEFNFEKDAPNRKEQRILSHFEDSPGTSIQVLNLESVWGQGQPPYSGKREAEFYTIHVNWSHRKAWGENSYVGICMLESRFLLSSKFLNFCLFTSSKQCFIFLSTFYFWLLFVLMFS